MSKHAQLAPSAFDSWFNCAGYLTAQRFAPQLLNEEAREGEIAHKLIAAYYATGLPLKALAAPNPAADEDMVAGCELFIKYIKSLELDFGYSELQLEPFDYMPMLWGTPDYFGFDDKKRILHVIDFKYGRDYVNHEANGQLLIYALLAALFRGIQPEYVITTIVQPRVMGADPIRKYATTFVDLRAWGETTLLEAYNRALSVLPARTAGVHCRFARCKTACPEYLSWCRGVIEPPFSDSPDRLADILTLKKSAIKLFEQAEFEGTRQLSLGGVVPGFKLVRKVKHSTIRDPGALEAVLLELGASEWQLFTPVKLKSAAQLSQEFATQPALKSAVDNFKVTPDGELTIAPLSDRRPAIATAAEAFSNV